MEHQDFRLIETIIYFVSALLIVLSQHFQSDVYKFLIIIIIFFVIGAHYFLKLKKDEIFLKKTIKTIKDEPK